MIIKIEVPLNITGFFSPYFLKNPSFSGSLGAGLVIKPGLKCLCYFSDKEIDKKNKNEFFFNNIKLKKEIKPIKNLLQILDFKKKIIVKFFSPVFLGYGYGLSGATTLALSFAIYRFFKKNNLKEAARIAYVSEIKSLTGLADVISIFSGYGLTVRTKIGEPGKGKVISFKQPKDIRIVTIDLKKVKTEKMLKFFDKEIKILGRKLTKKILKNPSLENFFEYSQLFAKKIKFADEKFFKKFEPIKKYCLGYSVKKGIFFLATKKKFLPLISSFLKKRFSKIHIFRLAQKPFIKN